MHLVPHCLAAEQLSPIRIHPQAKYSSLFPHYLKDALHFKRPLLCRAFPRGSLWGLFAVVITCMYAGSDYAGKQ